MIPTRKIKVLTIGNPVVDYILDSFHIPEWKTTSQNAPSFQFHSKQQLLEKVWNNPQSCKRVGGSALNSARVLGMASFENCLGVSAHYLGCCGDDDDGRYIAQECAKCNIISFMQVESGQSTGKCAIVIDAVTRDRSILCNRGAAGFLSVDGIKQMNPGIKECDIIFASAFNLTTESRREVITIIWKLSSGCELGFSLASEQVVAMVEVKECIESHLSKSHFIIGTASEIQSFAGNTESIQEQMELLARKLTIGGFVLATDGSNPVLLATQHSFNSFAVHETNSIVDTNGAGDTFAGCFLAQYAHQSMDKSLESLTIAVQAGINGSRLSLGSQAIEETSFKYQNLFVN